MLITSRSRNTNPWRKGVDTLCCFKDAVRRNVRLLEAAGGLMRPPAERLERP